MAKMALTRSILFTINRGSVFTTMKHTLSRSYISLSLSKLPLISSISCRRAPLDGHTSPTAATLRGFCTSSSLKNKDEGRDFEHWFIVVRRKMIKVDATRDEIIHHYIKILAHVVGSEDEARKKIYSVSTKHYFGFGALISQDLALNLIGIPEVGMVRPDRYEDVANKQYRGEPFINGRAVPYDPKYHEAYVKRFVTNAKFPFYSRRPKSSPSNYENKHEGP